MKLTFDIEIKEEGVICSGTANGQDVYDHAQANLMAVGALEIAKQSLLVQRWGMSITPALVNPEDSK